MSQPMTFEEAVIRQREMHSRVDAGENISTRAWRSHSLRDGYEQRLCPDYGMGLFEVDTSTDAVCEWDGRWSDEGDVLLCQGCFLDGT